MTPVHSLPEKWNIFNTSKMCLTKVLTWKKQIDVLDILDKIIIRLNAAMCMTNMDNAFNL